MPRAVRSDLRERYDIVVGGGQGDLKGKILRIGTMGDLSAADIVDALAALGAALQARGFGFDAAAASRASRGVLFPTPADVTA